MKQIAPEHKLILFIAPVRKGRPQQSVAEGKTFPLLIVLICLYLEKQEEELSLVQDVYKIQAVAGYNWYNTARPELRISSAMFEGLETDGIITLMNTATMELEDWQVKIFGVHDGVREIKGEIERHIGSKQDYGSEIGRIMFQYDRNEKEKDAGKAEFEAAPWDKQITESPCSWVEVPSLRSVVTTAAAVYSAVVTTVATTALSVASFGTLSAPMAALCAAGIGAAITLSAEASFAVADVAGGYKDWDEVGKDLAISAATSVISAAGGAAGAAIKGIGGIGGALLKTGVSMSTSATSTVATNAIKYAGEWNGFASSMASFDTWSGVITSGAGSLISNSLNLATIGDNGVKVTGFSSLNVNDMQSLNSVVGGLASSGLEYGLTGKTTLNVLNIADIGINSLVNRAIGNTAAPQVKASCGLLEVHLDNSQGASFALGTGGTDLSIGTVASAARGLDALKTNFEINHYTNKKDLQNAAIALRTQYGFGGKTENTQLKEILNGKTELKAGSGDGKAQTVRENGKRVVYLNGYKKDMTREEQLKLGITLGHEAYRDGVKGDEIAQKIETRNAVAGHTDLMAGMLADDMYKSMMSGIIAGDTNLQKDLLARSLGDDIFNAYVDGTYDSSADYWKLLSRSDGTHSIEWDGSRDITVEYQDKDEDGNWEKVGSDKFTDDTGSMAGSLGKLVGKTRATEILGSSLYNADLYDSQTLKDVLGLSDDKIAKIQRTGVIPSDISELQLYKLAGEALMKKNGITWDTSNGENAGFWNVSGLSDAANGNKLTNFTLTDNTTMGYILLNELKFDPNLNAKGNTYFDRFVVTTELNRNPNSWDAYYMRSEDPQGDSYNHTFDTNKSLESQNRGLDEIIYRKYNLQNNQIGKDLVTYAQTIDVYNTIDNHKNEDGSYTNINRSQPYYIFGQGWGQGNTVNSNFSLTVNSLNTSNDWMMTLHNFYTIGNDSSHNWVNASSSNGLPGGAWGVHSSGYLTSDGCFIYTEENRKALQEKLKEWGLHTNHQIYGTLK